MRRAIKKVGGHVSVACIVYALVSPRMQLLVCGVAVMSVIALCTVVRAESFEQQRESCVEMHSGEKKNIIQSVQHIEGILVAALDEAIKPPQDTALASGGIPVESVEQKPPLVIDAVPNRETVSRVAAVIRALFGSTIAAGRLVYTIFFVR